MKDQIEDLIKAMRKNKSDTELIRDMAAEIIVLDVMILTLFKNDKALRDKFYISIKKMIKEKAYGK